MKEGCCVLGLSVLELPLPKLSFFSSLKELDFFNRTFGVAVTDDDFSSLSSFLVSFDLAPSSALRFLQAFDSDFDFESETKPDEIVSLEDVWTDLLVKVANILLVML